MVDVEALGLQLDFMTLKILSYLNYESVILWFYEFCNFYFYSRVMVE